MNIEAYKFFARVLQRIAKIMALGFIGIIGTLFILFSTTDGGLWGLLTGIFFFIAIAYFMIFEDYKINTLIEGLKEKIDKQKT